MVPEWVLRNLILPQGQRLPQWKPFTPETARPVPEIDLCFVCRKNIICQPKWYDDKLRRFRCADCHKRYEDLQKNTKQSRFENKVYALPPSQEETIPEGNLEEDDYRFWIGVLYKMSGFAICRCCGESLY